MLALGANGWDAAIAIASAAASITGAVIAYLNRRALKVPSGGGIGERVERSHELLTTLVKHTHRLNSGRATSDPP